MRIQFLGAARSVTGSMHLIEANGHRILLDCGLFQGARDEAAQLNRNLKIDAPRVDAVVLSHAHVDHCGNLPTILRSGFRGRIHSTRATKDLADLMLRDSARIQLRDVEYLQKKGRRVVDPLYLPEHARAVIKRFRGWGYDETFDVVPGIRCTFRDAGHIIGSASVHLELREPGHEAVRVTFTGDLGRAGLPILRDPQPLPPAEILITESTYGGRSHGATGSVGDHMKQSLESAVLAATEGSGKLIIPAFSVGRTQNILYFLNELIAEGRLPVLPIYIDSPLSTDATELIRRHPECFDPETLAKLDQDLRPLLASHVKLARTTDESKAINRVRGTCVVISASGMCEFGRILHHLKQNIENPNAVIAFVGYQAHKTLGRHIVNGAKTVRIYGEEFSVRAKVIKLNGFSAHADRDELLAALQPSREAADQTFVVHGEEDQAEAFAASLRGRGYRGVSVPHPGDEFVI